MAKGENRVYGHWKRRAITPGPAFRSCAGTWILASYICGRRARVFVSHAV